MKLKDLITRLSVSGRFVITGLAYSKKTKEYYSFRTIMDISYNCYDSKSVLSELSENILECEVKRISQYSNEVWIDIIEWIDD